mmetsp:Transcript_33030/g.88364  ORF Transcript_33030/g.88364 Transcript_33030/m.88364 type:complete len:635 (-) Transcript_33030:331-2235(-)
MIGANVDVGERGCVLLGLLVFQASPVLSLPFACQRQLVLEVMDGVGQEHLDFMVSPRSIHILIRRRPGGIMENYLQAAPVHLDGLGVLFVIDDPLLLPGSCHLRQFRGPALLGWRKPALVFAGHDLLRLLEVPLGIGVVADHLSLHERPLPPQLPDVVALPHAHLGVARPEPPPVRAAKASGALDLEREEPRVLPHGSLGPGLLRLVLLGGRPLLVLSEDRVLPRGRDVQLPRDLQERVLRLVAELLVLVLAGGAKLRLLAVVCAREGQDQGLRLLRQGAQRREPGLAQEVPRDHVRVPDLEQEGLLGVEGVLHHPEVLLLVRIHDGHAERYRLALVRHVVAGPQAAQRLAQEGAAHHARDELLLRDPPGRGELDLGVGPLLAVVGHDVAVGLHGDDRGAPLAVAAAHEANPKLLPLPWEGVPDLHVVADVDGLHGAPHEHLAREQVEAAATVLDLSLVLQHHLPSNDLVTLLALLETLLQVTQAGGGVAVFGRLPRHNDGLQEAGDSAGAIEDAVGNQQRLAVREVQHAPVQDALRDQADAFQADAVLALGNSDKLWHNIDISRTLVATQVVPLPLHRVRVVAHVLPTPPMVAEAVVVAQNARQHILLHRLVPLHDAAVGPVGQVGLVLVGFP